MAEEAVVNVGGVVVVNCCGGDDADVDVDFGIAEGGEPLMLALLFLLLLFWEEEQVEDAEAIASMLLLLLSAVALLNECNRGGVCTLSAAVILALFVMLLRISYIGEHIMVSFARAVMEFDLLIVIRHR